MRTRARGFTLAETVMALSMTLVIGLALTGVAMALSNMQANNEDYYEHMHGTCAGPGWCWRLRPTSCWSGPTTTGARA